MKISQSVLQILPVQINTFGTSQCFLTRAPEPNYTKIPWYLDTNPNGKLVGVWIALEDIEETAGPFCIYSNSDTSKIDPLDFDFENLDSDFNFKSAFPGAVRYDFTARAGDILIWDSLSIHGALLPDNEAKTRKSITAHFYPLGLGIQDPPVKRFLSVYDHKKSS